MSMKVGTLAPRPERAGLARNVNAQLAESIVLLSAPFKYPFHAIPKSVGDQYEKLGIRELRQVSVWDRQNTSLSRISRHRFTQDPGFGAQVKCGLPSLSRLTRAMS